MEKNIFVRAFEIAPTCDTMDQLRKKLIREGYPNVEQHFQGRSIRAQVVKLLRRAKPSTNIEA